jgi:hypothetical protein
MTAFLLLRLHPTIVRAKPEEKEPSFTFFDFERALAATAQHFQDL